MYKQTKPVYSIKTCPSSDFEQLENLLNSMSDDGWELYSMHEVEIDGDYQYSCIFVKDASSEEIADDNLDLMGFKSKMERIMSPTLEPLDICLDIQKKIKDKRLKIAQIKALLDSTSEDNRNVLNQEISVTMRELDALKSKLIEVISPEIMQNKIGENKISISLSEELLDSISPDSDYNLISEIVKVRQDLTESLGYIIPKVKIESDDLLQANEFAIKVRGVDAIKAFSYSGYIMYFRDELNLSKLPKNIIKDIDYITGKQIIWIEKSKTKDFWEKGLDSIAFIGRLLKFVSIRHIEDIFDYSDINRYIEIVGAQNMYLIENIVPDFVSIAELKYILSNLIKEKISIKDIFYVFEKINDFADDSSKEDLLSKIRIALARQISANLIGKSPSIQAFELSDKTSNSFLKLSDTDTVIKVDGSKLDKIVSKINVAAEKYSSQSNEIILLVPLAVRHIIFLVLSGFIPNIRVIAKEEILSDYPVEILELI